MLQDMLLFQCLMLQRTHWTSWRCSLYLMRPVSVSESPYPCVSCYKEHIEQVGSVHCILISCLHLCSESVAIEQSASRSWCHEATASYAVPLKFWL